MTWRGTLVGLLLGFGLLSSAFRLDDQRLSNRNGNGRRVRRETYEVDGADASGLRSQLNQRGPLSAGRRFDARTEWNVHWRFDLERVAGGCRATRARVDLDVVVTLPHWRQPASAEANLVDRWERYLAALDNHEDGHRAIGFAAADEIQAAFADLPPGPTCALAEQRANRAGYDIVARHNRRDEQYDKETNHGATQGARFP